MVSEINEVAVFAAVTAVGIGCALVVDSSPVRNVWQWVCAVTRDAVDWCVIALACVLLADDLNRDRGDDY